MNWRNGTGLVIGIIIVFGLVLVGFVIIQQHHKPGYIQKSVDKDTGEVIYNEPNKTTEKQANPENLVILGSAQLIDAGLTQDQFQLVKQSLASYAQKQLQNKYSLLKIPTAGFSKQQNKITANLKLGETDTTLALTINYHDLTFVRVTVSDPKGNQTYAYDSGELSTTKDLTNQPKVQPDTN